MKIFVSNDFGVVTNARTFNEANLKFQNCQSAAQKLGSPHDIVDARTLATRITVVG